MENYGLADHEWLRGLYDIRRAWIPVYNRDVFFARMRTTQRSESINAFFNNFVHSGMTLREFVVKYDAAVDSRFEIYRREEFESRHKERRLTLNMPLEEHAAAVYTRNMFVRFHEQLSDILKLSKEKISKSDQLSSYRVWNKKDHNDDYIVSIDFTTLHVNCTCQLFEFMGILCRHILVIFHAKNIEEIPSHYILRRWMKDGNKSNSGRAGVTNDGRNYLRSFGLRQKYVRLDDLADTSDSAYKFINEALETIIATATGIVNNEDISIGNCDTHVASNQLAQESEVILKDPHLSQTRGRKRIKSGLEQSHKNTNICSNCGARGHNRRSCKQPRRA